MPVSIAVNPVGCKQTYPLKRNAENLTVLVILVIGAIWYTLNSYNGALGRSFMPHVLPIKRPFLDF